MKFLTALSTNATLRAYLEQRGYSDEDHQEGWRELLSVAGYQTPRTDSGLTSVYNQPAREAIVALDAWDEPNFRVIRATLERRHPEQVEYIFSGGLAPSQGAASVVGVATLLDRLDALEKGSSRKATRKADQAALEILSKRGITPEERRRLRSLVDTVRKAEQPASAPAPSAMKGAGEDAPQAEARRVALYRWYREWAEVARAVVRRKDHLILLGLARRKAAKRSSEG